MKTQYYVFLFISLLTYACEQTDKTVEEPLPEFFLTSTVTEVTETSVKIKGEIASIREASNDIFGIVYSEMPFPTIESGKLPIAANKGAFDLTAKNLKPKITYYFRAFLQTKSKIYYSNQLSSTAQYDSRWDRLEDVPNKYPFVTGILFYQNFGFGPFATLINTDAKGFNSSIEYGINWVDFTKPPPTINEWFMSNNASSSISSPLENSYIVSPNKDRIFVGGGFSINNALPSPKVFNQNVWLGGRTLFYLPCPLLGEVSGLTVGDRMFVFSTQSNGDVYEFTNLEWSPRKKNEFMNLGRIITAGNDTDTKGYVMTESENPKTTGGLFYEYNPILDKWTQKKSFMGDERIEGIMFSCKGKVYYGLGQNKKTLQALKDIWEYDPKTDSWKQVATYPGNGNVRLIQTVYKNVVYLGMGYQTLINSLQAGESSGVRDFWSFKP